MKLSFSWLQELVQLTKPITELTESLSMAGFEVEEVTDLSVQAQGVVVGYVKKVEPHPNSTKLNICSVDIGGSDLLQIVCGAKNVKANIHVLVATVGSVLSSIPVTIKESTIRGIKSQGMICALSELGIESKSEGIENLENRGDKFPNIGESVIKYLNLDDSIIELAITANRPDGMSIVGIAREISTITDSKLTIPELDYNSDFELFDLDISNSDCLSENRLYSLTLINNIDNTKYHSNQIIKNRIEKIGINSINPIVDITNYIMLEQGQPLHAFDNGLLKDLIGRDVLMSDFGIRRGIQGESFEALNDKIYKLNENMHVITCSNIPIAIAGVIGGKSTAVTSKTTSIWLECAVFSPISVRNNSREIGLRTESSSRFEKGIPNQNVFPVANRVTKMISDILRGKIISKYANKKTRENTNKIKLRSNRIHKILGQIKEYKIIPNIKLNEQCVTTTSPLRYINDNEIVGLLTSLGCNLERNNEGWDVVIPPYRSLDLTREIDLIEELARLIGYDNFDAKLPEPLQPGVLNPHEKVIRRLRHSFACQGFQEVVTSSLVSPPSKEISKSIPIANPLLIEASHLRRSIWPEHVEILKRNISSGSHGCWIYEVGKIYNYINDKYEETLLLSGAITGQRALGKWQKRDKNDGLDYYQARGKLTQVLQSISINEIDKKLDRSNHLHPGRSTSIFIEGKNCGSFGQIHPQIAEDNGLSMETYIYEIDLEKVIMASTRRNVWVKSFKEFPTVPSMERDIALVHSKEYSSKDILNLIKKTGSPLLEEAELIDKYAGDNIPKGSISHAFRIRYRDKKKTLKEEEINPVHEKIRKALVSKFKAELRS